MVRRATVLLLLILAGPLFGADPVKIVGETKVPPYRLVKLKIENKPEKSNIRWYVVAADPKNQPQVQFASNLGPRAHAPEWVAPPGDYRVSVRWIFNDEQGIPDFDETPETVVTILPPGPKPVDPDVKPVDPDVKPSAAPIPKPGLRVMIVREADANAVNALTPGQRQVILNGQAWDFLRANTVTEPVNPGGAWRIIDPQTNPLTNGDPDGATWAEALKRPRTALPWLLISNGTRNVGYEGPLPADTDAAKFIEFVGRYK